MFEKEEWRPIKGYPKYMVSNLGKVKSLDYSHTGKEKILAEVKDKDGYLSVKLCNNGVIKRFRIHRLVAMVFLEPIEGKDIVDHIDGNVQNNTVFNLRYCTNRENCNFELALKHYKEAANTPEKKEKISKKVIQYTLDGEFVAEYPSATEAQIQTGIDMSSISRCCRGKVIKDKEGRFYTTRSAGGFIWEYAA